MRSFFVTTCVFTWSSQALLVRSSQQQQQQQQHQQRFRNKLPLPFFVNQRQETTRTPLDASPSSSSSSSSSTATTATAPSTSSTRLVSSEQCQAFERDGYIVLRNLFSEEEVDRMVEAGNALVRISQQNRFQTFSVVEKNLIYGHLGTPAQVEAGAEEKRTIVQTFRQVALRSKLPQICAELMALDPGTQCLRLIRDVFLAKYVSQGDTCDWHVDDQSFWPESFLSTASKESERDQNGINVWIALDDYTVEHGGSMIVSAGSHKAPWRHEAYQAIGQDRTVDGGITRDVLAKRLSDPNYNGTCALDLSSPEIRRQAEQDKVEFDLNKGDCIVATRLLFHRTSQVTPAGAKHYQALGKKLLHRYSLRYVPGSARLPQGHTLSEMSAQYDKRYAGQSLNDIACKFHQPAWYPKLWPGIESDLDAKLDCLAQNALPVALEQAQKEREAFLKLLPTEKLNQTFRT